MRRRPGIYHPRPVTVHGRAAARCAARSAQVDARSGSQLRWPGDGAAKPKEREPRDAGSVTASEFSFLALGLVLGVVSGAALVEFLRARPPAPREVRLTVAHDAIPRRSSTLADDAFTAPRPEPARGGPADRRRSGGVHARPARRPSNDRSVCGPTAGAVAGGPAGPGATSRRRGRPRRPVDGRRHPDRTGPATPPVRRADHGARPSADAACPRLAAIRSAGSSGRA